MDPILQELAGKRFVLLKMGNDPDPVPPGSEGVIDSAVRMGDCTHLNVTWDPVVKRSLNLVIPPDKIALL